MTTPGINIRKNIVRLTRRIEMMQKARATLLIESGATAEDKPSNGPKLPVMTYLDAGIHERAQGLAKRGSMSLSAFLSLCVEGSVNELEDVVAAEELEHVDN